MKQIPLLQGKALLIELPEGATDPEIYGRSLTYDTPEVDEWGYDYQAVKLPEGNWRIIGTLSEVTEDGLASVVGRKFDDFQVCQKLNQQPQYDMFWVRYPSGECKYFDTKDECYLHALKMKLESAILAEGYYLDENPVKVHTWASENADDYRKQWEEGKKRVLCRERCLLLGREG